MVPRGDPRQHPALRARHRRRQPAVVGSGVRGDAKYGKIIAPPCFLFPLNRIISRYVGGLPGVHAMWSGAERELVPPARGAVTQITTEAYLKDLIRAETPASPAARSSRFTTWTSTPTASLPPAVTRGASGPSATRRVSAARSTTTSHEAPRPSRRSSSTRSTRSTRPRRVPRRRAPLHRGRQGRRQARPAGQGPDDGHRLHLPTRRLGRPLHPGQHASRPSQIASPRPRHPKDKYGVPDVPERVHWDDDLAKLGRRARVPTTTARSAPPGWLHQITDWMGDDGFVAQPTRPRSAGIIPRATCCSSRAR